MGVASSMSGTVWAKDVWLQISAEAYVKIVTKTFLRICV